MKNKIAFFGVNNLAFEILNLSNLDKDLIVLLNKKKSEKFDVEKYCNKISNLRSNHKYFANKYSLKSESDEAYLRQYSGDIGIVIGWNRLIPSSIINSFKYGMLGLHGTPYGLPKGRGRSPAIWSLVLGQKKYHYYLFKLTEGVDDGPIYAEEIIDITEFDDINSFYKKLAVAASSMIDEIVPKIIDGNIDPIQQNKGEASFFPKRGYEHGKIDWQKTTSDIYNLIRAITKPYPCAHTFYENKEIKIIWAIPFSLNRFENYEPGQICASFSDNSYVVKTGDGTMLLADYQPQIEFKVNNFLL